MTAALPAGDGRTVPHSLEAEQAVLGAALLSPTAAGEVLEQVQPHDFYRSTHRLVFEAIAELYLAGQPIDALTVLDWLTRRGRLDDIGGGSAIHDLIAQVPSAANASHYARIVRDTAARRRLIQAGAELAQFAHDQSCDLEQAVDRSEQALYHALQGGAESHCTPAAPGLSETLTRIEERSRTPGGLVGLPTGFRDLDQLTKGLRPGNLVVLAGRPAMGKSSLALDIARRAAHSADATAVMFSLEMTQQELFDRMLAAQARVDLERVIDGQLDTRQWDKLVEGAAQLSQARLFIDDTPGLSLPQIRSTCRRLHQRHRLDLVVVDYLQLLPAPQRAENRVQEVAQVSAALKALAKDLHVPVLALSQLSRATEHRVDKRPHLADLRESGAIEQDADLVLLLYRDEVYDPDTPNRGIAELQVAKHRNGPTGVVKLAFLAHLSSFADLASHQRAA